MIGYILPRNIFLLNPIKSENKLETKKSENKKIYRHLKGITVKILTAGGAGSGVLIKKKGITYEVITAWHVVKDNLPSEEIWIITSDGEKHLFNKNSLKQINKFDMAILSFSSKNNYELAKFNEKNDFEISQKIFLAGFPINEKFKSKINEGTLIINSNINFGKGYRFFYSNKAELGMSGGPILNKDGFLIGIHGRAELSEINSLLYSNNNSTLFRQGLPIKHYKDFIFDKSVDENNLKLTSKDYLAKAIYLWHVDSLSKEIIELAKKSIDLEPNFWAYYLLYNYKFNDLNQTQRSILVNTALDLPYSNNDRTTYSRAIIQSFNGNYDEAINGLSKAIDQNPEFSLSLSLRGQFKSFSGDKKGALEDITGAIVLDPNMPNFYLLRAWIHLDRVFQDYDAAIADFNKYLTFQPRYLPIIFEVGKIKVKQNKYQEAINYFKKAINIFEIHYSKHMNFNGILHPGFGYIPFTVNAIYEAYAEAEIKLGNKKSGIEIYEKLISIIPNIYSYKSEDEIKEISKEIYSKIENLKVLMDSD